MRRDMDLIRGLLLKLEALDKHPLLIVGFDRPYDELAVDGFSDDDIDHHMDMLFDAGFIEAGTSDRGPMSGGWHFKKITWEGRDFLDSVRDQGAWSKTKEGAGRLGGWTADLLAGLAKAYAKAEIKAKLGVDL